MKIPNDHEIYKFFQSNTFKLYQKWYFGMKIYQLATLICSYRIAKLFCIVLNSLPFSKVSKVKSFSFPNCG
jgi:hypothetical protein